MINKERRSIMKTVYWANYSSASKQSMANYLIPQPEKLIDTLFTNSINNRKGYSSCLGAKASLKNTYCLKSPFDIDITYDENDSPVGERADWFYFRERSYENRINVELDLGWIFFCEESLIIEQTPPYSHNTSFAEYGMSSTGSFDIGSWFRPVMASFILWEGKNRFVVKENEPLAYLRFLTNDTINLKQFELTQKIVDLAEACVHSPNYYKPMLPLVSRYKKFTENKINQIVIKEIKNNLID